MSLFQRRFTCFYCGNATSQRWKRGLQQFECDRCEAVNYLDEKGEIRDPPAPSAVEEVPRYISPPPELSFYQPKYESEEIFCRTCLQNQHIVATALAEHDYDETLPERKAQLERQYPQVCRNCRPRVEKKLQDANYLAKTDHLRRQAIKTRQGRTGPSLKRTWRDGALFVGCCLWWASLSIEILWHLVGLLPVSPIQDGPTSRSPIVMLACSTHSFFNREIPPDCLAAFNSLEKLGLILGLISVCWHSKLSDKLHNPYLRMSGYSDYFFVQVFTLGLRTLLWWNLQGQYRSHIWGGAPVSALHATFLVLTVVSTFVGAQRVQIKRTAVDFLKRSPSTVVVADDRLTPTATPAPETFRTSTHITSTFPVSKLATPYDVSEVELDLGYASASEADADETKSIATTTTQDEMDWTPTQPIRPLAPLRPMLPPAPSPYNLRSSARTPFHGTLPPAPQPPAHKALKPKAPVFKATSEQKRHNFFAQMMSRDNNGADFGGRQARRADYEIQEGKLMVPDKDSGTGLEGLFSSSFQIDDDPRARMRQRANPRARETGFDVPTDPDPPRDLSFMISVFAVLGLVGCILGVTNLILPGFYGSIARSLAYVWRS